MTTLITGATGNVGRLLVADLVARGVDLRALSRDPTKAALPDGVEVAEGDLSSAGGAVFDGVDTAFVFPADEGVDGFVERALDAGVQRFVVLSSLAVSERNARDGGSATAAHHRAVEHAVTSRTDAHIILRPGNFATNLLFWAFPIRSGYPVRIPYPTSSQVLIHEADVAAAAAEALSSPDSFGPIVELTGPASLTKIEQLGAISAAISREIPHIEIGPDEFRADMAQYMPSGIVEMLLRYWSETVDEPEVPLHSQLPEALASRIGGGTPLARWAQDHRSDFTG
ncbi:SDR family oxidoreductase [Naasia lichenicola]|uniref:Nucleoside-diphosphate sugar epimerase n=1 Tax=Naasia lichenicola TaxID=2565933 RepID=A0A4S4FN43_9MICO|nr:NAD(P)H-binding protein [Naasia lichenicola]THG31678.1 nucleoside-diphosphate sugar epimerase [Naasia lichenicola]